MIHHLIDIAGLARFIALSYYVHIWFLFFTTVTKCNATYENFKYEKSSRKIKTKSYHLLSSWFLSLRYTLMKNHDQHPCWTTGPFHNVILLYIQIWFFLFLQQQPSATYENIINMKNHEKSWIIMKNHQERSE